MLGQSHLLYGVVNKITGSTDVIFSEHPGKKVLDKDDVDYCYFASHSGMIIIEPGNEFAPLSSLCEQMIL